MAPDGAPIGLGLCELVDQHGRPRSAQTLDWRDLDVPSAFAATGPVVVDSDVRTAGRAEALLGAGRDFPRLVFLNVGTGISYCLLRDGVPDPGARGYAIIVGAPAVEDVAGGAGLAALAGEQDARAVLADPRHAASGRRRRRRRSGAAIAALVNALDPDAVVIGGGLGLVQRLPRGGGRGRAPVDLGRGRAGPRRSCRRSSGGTARSWARRSPLPRPGPRRGSPTRDRRDAPDRAAILGDETPT